jgi:hypothetical protein
MLAAVAGMQAEKRDRADQYAAAVYGSIIAAALIEAFRSEHVHAEETALSVLATMLVFFLAHVWSSILGERLHRRGALGLHRVGEIVASEWPLVEASFGPILVLLLGWTGVLADTTAEELALVVCLLQLFGWGMACGLRAYDRWWAGVGSGLVNGALGLVVVSLEVVVLH